MKIIFDSSTLISLSSSCLINVLREIKKEMNAEFIMPKSVEYECITKPLKINRFELNAVRIRKSVRDKVITVAEQNSSRDAETERLSHIANNIFYSGQKTIDILQIGELEMLALAKETGAEILAVDERTARMIVENPSSIQKLISRRRHKNIGVNRQDLEKFKEMFNDIAFVRSTELIAFAYEKGLLEQELGLGKQTVEAALYSLKFNGCGISFREINEFLDGV